MNRSWMKQISLACAFCLLTFALVAPSGAQDACDQYATSVREIDASHRALEQIDADLKASRFAKENDYESARKARKQWEDTLRNQSVAAAHLLELCDQLIPMPQGSEQAFNRFYQLGIRYADGGNCSQALGYLQKCRRHPNPPLGLQNHVRNLIAYCEGVTRDPESKQLGLAYSGKAAYILRDQVKWIVDDRPYTSLELERLGTRTFATDEVPAATVALRKLSPEATIVARSPFVLVAGPEQYPGQFSERYLERVYDELVFPSTERLRAQYFNKEPQSLIPIYLVAGEAYKDGLQSFNAYCETVHFRSCGLRVSYYLQYDNSVMVWFATGGGTLNHELVHALMEADFPGAPGWLAEGLASLHEELDAGWRPLDNYRMFYAQAALAQFGRLIPLEQLFALSQADMNSGPYVALNSAMSRYFALYLYQQGVLSSVYSAIRDGHAESAAAQMAIVQAQLKKPDSEIQADWERWLKNRPEPPRWRELKSEIVHEMQQMQASSPVWAR